MFFNNDNRLRSVGLRNAFFFIAAAALILLIFPNSGGSAVMAAPGELIAGGLSGPFGMALDSAGNLYIANEGSGGGGQWVSKLPPGGPLDLIFSDGYIGPSGVAFNSVGELFVSDDTNQVYLVDLSDGSRSVFLPDSFGLQNPNAIAFDSADNLYVVSAGGFISVFGPSGALVDLNFAGGYNTPQAIVIDESNHALYISDIEGKIYLIDKSTGASSLHADTGRGGTQGGLVMDAAGDLYLAAYEQGEVVRVAASDGTVWVCQRGINQPRGLAFDAGGNLLITSYADGEIYRVEGCEQPIFSAWPAAEAVEAWGWPEGTPVDLTVVDGSDPSLVHSDSALSTYVGGGPGATFVRFDLPSEVDLNEGDQVTVSGSGVTKMHTVTGLTIDGADPSLETVWGAAASGSDVQLSIHDQAGTEQTVLADAGGWSGDFSGIWDLEPGVGVVATQPDVDGDWTHAEFFLPPPGFGPSFQAKLVDDRITGFGWPEGALVDLRIEDPAGGTVYADQQPAYYPDWSPDTTWVEFEFAGIYDLKPGDFVELSDGNFIKTHTVRDLAITGLDLDADLIFGTADVDSFVSVFPHDDCCWGLQVQAVGGSWTADLSTVLYDDGRIGYDLRPGSDGGIEQTDDDGDSTWIQWRVPNPTFGVRADEDRIEGWEWPLGAEVTLEIDWDQDPVTPPLYTEMQTVSQAEWDPNQTWLHFELWEVFDIQPDMYVTLSDGPLSKAHWVTELAIAEVDEGNELVLGSAAVESQVNIWICDESGCADRGETADGDGKWTANFSVPGDEDWEQVTWDIGPGTWIDSGQWDEDGDGTLSGWYVEEPAPPPYFSVVVNHQEVHGQHWPLGATLTLTIDDPATTGEGFEPDFVAEAVVEPAPWDPGTQTFVVFDLIDFHPDPAALMAPGNPVTLSNGEITKIHVILPLNVDQVDPLTDTFAGTRDGAYSVLVGFDSGDGEGFNIEIPPGTDAWSASSPQWIVEPFRGGHAEQQDEDGDSTQFQIRLPMVEMRAGGSTMVEDFSHHSAVRVQIFRAEDGSEVQVASHDIPTLDEYQFPPQFSFLDAYGFEPLAGDRVVATDQFSGLVKGLEMPPLSITHFDEAGNVLQGTGPPAPTGDDPPWFGLHLIWDEQQWRGEMINAYYTDAQNGLWALDTMEAFGLDLTCEMGIAVVWVDEDYDAAFLDFSVEAWLESGSFAPNPVAVEQFIDGSAAFGASVPIHNLQVLIADSPEMGWADLIPDDGAYDSPWEGGTFENLQVPSVAGVYPVIARAQTECGEWYGELGFLAVYDPNGGFVTGGGQIVPGGNSSYDDDWLPEIDGSSPAAFGFNVKYKKGASVPSGHILFQYTVGDFKLQSGDFDWLLVTNSVWARFRGTATIDGMEGLFPFRVDARDSDKLGGNQDDRFIIRVWEPGADPDSDDPIYKASGDVQGQIVIHDHKDPSLILGGLFEFSSGLDLAIGTANAVQLAVDQANQVGGVLGSPIALFSRDAGDGGNPDQTVSSALDLIENRGANALIGPLFSSNTQAILADIVVPSGVVLVSPSNTDPGLAAVPDNGLYFRMSDPETLRGRAAAVRACDLGHHHAVILQDLRFPFTSAIVDEFSAAFPDCSSGGTVRLVTFGEDEAEDYAAALQSAFGGVSPAPDMVLMVTFEPHRAVQMVEHAFCQAASDGSLAYDRYWSFPYEGQLDAIAGGIGNFPCDPPTLYDLQGYEEIAPAFYYDLGDGNFHAAYWAAFGGDPSVFSNLAYDAAALLILAAEEAGSVDSHAIRDHLHSVSSGGLPVSDLAEALELVRQGVDIDWQGTFERSVDGLDYESNQNFEPDGESISPYLVRQVQTGGLVNFVDWLSDEEITP